MSTALIYLGFIPGYVLFWGIFAVALGTFIYRIRQLLQYIFIGTKPNQFTDWGKRIGSATVYVLSQFCHLKNFRSNDRASLGHAFIAWGFFVFVLFYFFFIILAEGFGLTGLQSTGFFFYYAWVMDIAAVLVIIGAGWGLVRRFIVRPDRLKGEQTMGALVVLLSVFTHPFTHLFKEATSIAMAAPPAGLGHSLLPPVSEQLSHLFTGSVHSMENWHVAFFWAHWLTVLFVLVYIPYSRYLHIIAAPFNGILRSWRPGAVLEPIDFEEAESLGVARIDDLTWKQNLDLYSCVMCGNCQEQCPAFATGKPLNPKELIQDLKAQLLSVGPELVRAKKPAKRGESADDPAVVEANVLLAGNVIQEDAVWACTTCGACDLICPAWVEHVDKVIGLRRNLVMERSLVPETGEGALRGIEQRGHPWRGTTLGRTDWADGLEVKIVTEDADVDILYWVGCTAALEQRSIKIARSFAAIMKQAGLSFAVLGSSESCCGDPARRLGNEYLFQMQAEKNIALFVEYGMKRIVTACPHCFNTLKHEYPQFGGSFEVLHHSELIADLVDEGRINLDRSAYAMITYHDSCYLGRQNGIYAPPRRLLESIPETALVEMEAHGRRGFCCGGGGGRMWLEERIGQRISERRIEQAIATKAEVVATACPFCLQMLDDATRAKEADDSLEVKDIAEIVAEALGLQDSQRDPVVGRS